MRELGIDPLVVGRGTTLTGRGTTLAGAGGGTDGTAGGIAGAAAGGSGCRSQAAGSSVGLAVLESFSSPIDLAARALGSRQANLPRSSLCQQLRASRREMPPFPASATASTILHRRPRAPFTFGRDVEVEAAWPPLRMHRGAAPAPRKEVASCWDFS